MSYPVVYKWRKQIAEPSKRLTMVDAKFSRHGVIL